MKASGATCAGTNGEPAGGLTALMPAVGAIVLMARATSGGAFPSPANSRTSWVVVGNCGHEDILRALQRSSTTLCRLPRSGPPAPAQAVPTLNQTTANVPTERAITEELAQLFMACPPFFRDL